MILTRGLEKLPVMRTIEMTVIATPPKGIMPLLRERAARRAIVDGGPLAFACGSCGHEVLEGVRALQIRNFAIRCRACGAVNTAPSQTPSA